MPSLTPAHRRPLPSPAPLSVSACGAASAAASRPRSSFSPALPVTPPRAWCRSPRLKPPAQREGSSQARSTGCTVTARPGRRPHARRPRAARAGRAPSRPGRPAPRAGPHPGRSRAGSTACHRPVQAQTLPLGKPAGLPAMLCGRADRTTGWAVTAGSGMRHRSPALPCRPLRLCARGPDTQEQRTSCSSTSSPSIRPSPGDSWDPLRAA